MKNKLLIAALILMMTVHLFHPVTVLADEEQEDEYNVYTIDFLSAHDYYSAQEQKGTYCHGTITFLNMKLTGYVSAGDGRTDIYLYTYDNDGNYEKYYNYIENLESSAYSVDCESITGYHYGNSIDEWDYESEGGLYGQLTWNYNLSIDEVGYYNFDFPLFSSEEAVLGFIAGDVPMTEAENYEKFAPCQYGVLEVPQNIKVSSPVTGIFADQDITITWTQNDENYLKWETEILVYNSLKARPSLLGISFADWKHYDDVFLYQDKVNCRRMKYLIKDDDLADLQFEWLEENAADYNVFKDKNITIFLRNKYYDGKKTYYSNWVKVFIDLVEDFVTTEEGSATILEELKYDDVTGDEGKDFENSMPSGNVNGDSSYNGTIIENENASLDLMSYIKNGFGLLGDNGVVAMLSDVLNFIPDFVWLILGAGLSIMVVIGVAKYVF